MGDWYLYRRISHGDFIGAQKHPRRPLKQRCAISPGRPKIRHSPPPEPSWIEQRIEEDKEKLQREKDRQKLNGKKESSNHGALRPVVYERAELEWYIKLFLGVHFADNLA